MRLRTCSNTTNIGPDELLKHVPQSQPSQQQHSLCQENEIFFLTFETFYWCCLRTIFNYDKHLHVYHILHVKGDCSGLSSNIFLIRSKCQLNFVVGAGRMRETTRLLKKNNIPSLSSLANSWTFSVKVSNYMRLDYWLLVHMATDYITVHKHD